MPVPEEMRRIEEQIDNSIASHQMWKFSRSVLLRQILEYYRDFIEVLMANMSFAILEDRPNDVHLARMLEHRMRFGVFQSLKWAMEFASEGKGSKAPSSSEIHSVVELGGDYEVIVDYLKSAKHDLVTIKVDQQERTVTIYEGGDLTGSDSQLVSWQQETPPTYSHVDLTHDSDQLTRHWNAGQFRTVVAHMSDFAASASDEVCRDLNGQVLPLFLRPTVVEIRDFHDAALNAVLDDLTLTPKKVRGNCKWGLTSFLDTPLVQIGRQKFAVSDMLIAFQHIGGYDHMLRIANRVDPDQYRKVSGFREPRMMDFCRKEFEIRGWCVETGIKIPGPPQREIDVLANRGASSVLLQLKSTLRPEAPWEVFKRNQDILEGIRHTAEVVRMLPQKPASFVITDGYRGDYATWASALDNAIPIGTLRDIADIASDPLSAVDLLKRRVGFDLGRPVQPISDRFGEIMGWEMRVVDAPPPM